MGGASPPPTPPHGGMYTCHAIFGFWGLFVRHSGDDFSSFSSFVSPKIANYIISPGQIRAEELNGVLAEPGDWRPHIKGLVGDLQGTARSSRESPGKLSEVLEDGVTGGLQSSRRLL